MLLLNVLLNGTLGFQKKFYLYNNIQNGVLGLKLTKYNNSASDRNNKNKLLYLEILKG